MPSALLNGSKKSLKNKIHPSPQLIPACGGTGKTITAKIGYIIEKENIIPQILAPGISEESCVIIGQFHDIGKVGMPGKPYFLPEIKDGKPTGAYSINHEVVAMSLSLRSLYLVS
jgi:hypothetical protein